MKILYNITRIKLNIKIHKQLKLINDKNIDTFTAILNKDNHIY